MNPAKPRPTKCLAALLAATAVPAACGEIVSLSPAQINGQAKAASFANDDVTLVPLIGTTPATFNSLAARLGIPGTNTNAFNDPDTNPDNGNEQKLRFVFAPDAGLAGLSWDWSRADGPGSRSGVTITGFTADPGATFSGNTAGFTASYNAGTLFFKLPNSPAFGDADGSIHFSNPAASGGSTLLLKVCDEDQAAAQLAITRIQYDDSLWDPIVSFTASAKNRVPAGTPVTLSWVTRGDPTLTLDPGGIDVTGLGSTIVTPSATTTYTLTASGDGYPDLGKSLMVHVGDEPFPNIIVFFLDDFGWADWEQNGAPTGSLFHETPNFNRLAAEGKYFSNGYAASPVCSPTRGALLGGQSPARNKLSDWITGSGDAGKPIREAVWTKRLPASTPTFARALADQGYRSIHIGKWHLGSAGEPEADPLNLGFQINIGGNHFGTPPAPERYFASSLGFPNLPNLGPQAAPAGSYLTDVLTAQTLNQIRTAAADSTPFLIYLSHYAVHTPLQAPAATIQKYQNKLDANPGKNWQGQTNPTYAAMVEHVDRSLGAILAALDDPDGDPATPDSIAADTLVVLTSDNGGLLSSTSNRPLRHGKGGNYEGGIREPWIFRWPGKIAPGVSPEPIVTHDLYPTLLARAGVAPPAGYHVDGQDLSPLLAGEPFERQRPLVFHYPHWSPADQIGSPFSAIRKGDWKLVHNYAGASWELYNLANDPGESQNLIASRTDTHAILSWLLADGLEKLDANYPRAPTSLLPQPPVPLVTPEEDTDSDGKLDLDELIQGTDPRDAQSFFAPGFLREDDRVAVSFPGLEGRSYALEASGNLLPGSWQTIGRTGPLAAGRTVSLEDFSSGNQRFYRLATRYP